MTLAGLLERGADVARTHSLVGSRQEDDLAVGGLGHGLHSFEVTDLHGGSGAQDVGGLAHQLGRLDLKVYNC